MPYTINNNNSRNLRIQHRIADAAAKDVTALTELLKIDTSLDTTDFLSKFRNLKTQYPFINDLCQRKGFFGSIGYFFRGDDYRAGRYKIIIEQLKVGSYNNVSYFQNARAFKESVCEKVEEIKNFYLAKTYKSKEDENYKEELKVFTALKNFNGNVGFKSPEVKFSKENTNKEAWSSFLKIYPQYNCLNARNQELDDIYNIYGKSMLSLKQEVISRLGVDKVKNLFNDNTNDISDEIKEAIHNKYNYVERIFLKINKDLPQEQHVLPSEIWNDLGIYDSVDNICAIRNKDLPKDQHILPSEIWVAISKLYKATDSDLLPLFLDKASTKLHHSILIYKDAVLGTYNILIKPAIRNLDSHENIQKGSYKYVKTSGVLIKFNKSKGFEDSSQVVTVSASPFWEDIGIRKVKDKMLEKQPNSLKDSYIKDGFTPLQFQDNKNQQRMIFVQSYYGEDIISLLTANKITTETKQVIAKQIIRNFKFSMHDIKLENMLWNGTVLKFIDYTTKTYSHPTVKYTKETLTPSGYSTLKNSLEQNYIQIYGLCNALSQLMPNNKTLFDITQKAFMHYADPNQTLIDLSNLLIGQDVA